MNNQIRIVMVEPGKPAYETYIENSLKGMQRAIDGFIETVYDEDGGIIVCNEEAKLRNMKGNRRFGNDIVAGPFFIVGNDMEDCNFVSLTDEQVAHYIQKFAVPEDISDQEVADSMTAFVIFG